MTSTVLYCTVLYCTVLYCTVLYCTVLYCTVLFCTVLYCTVLYYNYQCVLESAYHLMWTQLHCLWDVVTRGAGAGCFGAALMLQPDLLSQLGEWSSVKLS